MAITREQVAELFVATFSRAPLSGGLDYWISQDITIEELAQFFYNSDEAKLLYPDGTSNEDFVISIFDNLLDRAPLAAGLTYWANALDDGRVSRDQMMLASINAINSDPTTDDYQILANKTEVGLYHADQGGDLSLSKRILEDVNATVVSRDRALSTLDLYEAAVDLNYIELTDDDDTLVLGDSNDWIYAFGGNDTLQASDGIKWVHGGIGVDMLYGGTEDDTFHGAPGDDTMYGYGGADTLYGDDGNDSIHGNDDGDLIYGDGGDDFLYGDDGDDTLYGGEGDDTLNGGEGIDTLYGNAGKDLIDGNEGIAIIDGGAGDDILHGGSSNDTIYCGGDNDIAYGRQGNDTIDGMKGDDTLYGGAGTDYLNGNSGSDSLYGGSGDDILLGESEADHLCGDAGSDTLSGGAGSDTFIFQTGDSDLLGYDKISDFALEDRLVLVSKGVGTLNNTALDVNSALTLDDAANIAAVGDGSVNAIVSWFVYDQDTYIVEDMSQNVDGTFVDGIDLIIQLQGVIALDGELNNIVLFS